MQLVAILFAGLVATTAAFHTPTHFSSHEEPAKFFLTKNIPFPAKNFEDVDFESVPVSQFKHLPKHYGSFEDFPASFKNFENVDFVTEPVSHFAPRKFFFGSQESVPSSEFAKSYFSKNFFASPKYFEDIIPERTSVPHYAVPKFYTTTEDSTFVAPSFRKFFYPRAFPTSFERKPFLMNPTEFSFESDSDIDSTFVPSFRKFFYPSRRSSFSPSDFTKYYYYPSFFPSEASERFFTPSPLARDFSMSSFRPTPAAFTGF